MSMHKKIHVQLYEYIRGELPPEAALRIAEHLETCTECRAEVEALRSTIGLLPEWEADPASRQPAEFWSDLLSDVRARIAPSPHPASALERLTRRFRVTAVTPRRIALVFASFALLALSTSVTWYVLRQQPSDQIAVQSVTPESSADAVQTATDERLQHYLRRSRILLVGVANLPLQEEFPPDLSLERRTSRELVAESRALKHRVRDEQAARLIGDMEKILIELANMDDDVLLPNIVLVRDGIERKNLLFKIRIAESLNTQVHHANSR